jgi:hypothetical protein
MPGQASDFCVIIDFTDGSQFALLGQEGAVLLQKQRGWQGSGLEAFDLERAIQKAGLAVRINPETEQAELVRA